MLGIVRVAGEIAPNDPDLVEKTTAGTSVATARRLERVRIEFKFKEIVGFGDNVDNGGRSAKMISEFLMPISVLIAAAVLLAGVAVWLGRTWLKYRGQRVITCPENKRPAAVVVDAAHAAATVFGKAPELRLSECSRWPEKAGCGQECLSEIRESGADCLVRNIIAKWYGGKACAACGQAIGEIDWTGSHPALLVADRETVEWNQIPADKLLGTLAAALPICFACHTANKLVKEHPEVVTDRHRAGA